MTLSPRHQIFADAILRGSSQTDAAIEAGYSERSAYNQANRLMKNDEVIAYIAERRTAASERAEVTIADVVRNLSAIAFSDLRDAVTWTKHGTLTFVASEDLPDAAAAAVKKIRVTDKGMSLEMHDKLSATVRIGEHLGMWPKTVRIEDYRKEAQAAADALGIDVEEVLAEAKKLTGTT